MIGKYEITIKAMKKYVLFNLILLDPFFNPHVSTPDFIIFASYIKYPLFADQS